MSIMILGGGLWLLYHYYEEATRAKINPDLIFKQLHKMPLRDLLRIKKLQSNNQVFKNLIKFEIF